MSLAQTAQGFTTALALIAAIALSGCSQDQTEAPPVDDAFVKDAAHLADRLQSELKAELSTALSSTGPVGAIGVCQSAAPAIAQSLSDESGLKVGRIARKTRNPGNDFDSDLAALYEKLEQAPLKDGGPAAIHANVGNRSIYMRAIPMQEQPCAVCHGTDIAPEVQAAITASYPNDRATGFAPGELRGAIVVQTGAAALPK